MDKDCQECRGGVAIMIDIIQQLKIIMTGNEKVAEEETHSHFSEYKNFFKKDDIFNGYIKGVKNIFEMTDSGKAVVLDIGCGFGLMSMIIAAYGSTKVIGVDLNPDVIKVFRMLLSRLKPPLENVEADTRDGVTLDFNDETFDVIIVSDVASHVYDLNVFLNNIKRMLKKGGRLYLYDSNNSVDIRGHIYRMNYWKKVEQGPVGSALLPPKPFIEMRKEIIRKSFPSLDERTLQFLSKKTMGMWGNEIIKAVDEFMKGGKITLHRGFKYIDPRNGAFAELEFNPFKFKNMLETLGFQAKVIPPFTCFPYPCGYNIKNKIKRGLRYCYPVSLLFSPSFEILAKL